MRIITERSRILEIVKRWDEHYPRNIFSQIRQDLCSLDLNTASREDIIGNYSWTNIGECSECKKKVERLVSFGICDYDEEYVEVCGMLEEDGTRLVDITNKCLENLTFGEWYEREKGNLPEGVNPFITWMMIYGDKE
jgi:hypothetical protein